MLCYFLLHLRHEMNATRQVAVSLATRQVAVSLATRQVAYFSSPYFRRIIIHTLETKFVYG